jgi:hypothetical protein
MKTPDTKTILNITLIIGIFIVGKKILEKFNFLDTKDDKIADELDKGTTADTSNVSQNAPVGLALNPNYWKSILGAYNKTRQAQGKPKYTGSQIVTLLTFAPPLANASFTFRGLIFDPLLDNIKKVELINLQKKRPTTGWENTYLFLAFKIKNAKGFFKDNANIVFDSFVQLKSKAQISYLSNIFSLYYNEDLASYLNTFLDSTERTRIYDIIKNKKLL